LSLSGKVINIDLYYNSKSLNDTGNRNSSSFINRPLVSLNKPELQMNSKNYLEFSPTVARKNSIITSNVMRNYSSSNGVSYGNSFNKISNGNTTGNLIQSYSHKNKNESSFLPLGRHSLQSNSTLNFAPSKNRSSILFNIDENKSGVKTTGKQTESIEDFCRELDTNPRKTSYIEKFSPKKKRSSEA
jgi:hypothetical protein